jgi:hypothetical protein
VALITTSTDFPDIACSSIGIPPSCRHDIREELHACVNALMNRLKPPFLVNENHIETLLEMVEGADNDDGAVYWLLIARLAELGLLCAGNYADNCEFAAAGDLLVNPRRVEIHIRGIAEPLVKHRHGRLSDQLRQWSQRSSRGWFEVKREAHPVITKPAILPHLHETMRQSGRFNMTYLTRITTRMQKIADTIGFLTAGSFQCAEDLYSRGKEGAGALNEFVEKHLCRFDTFLYHRLGQHIDALLTKEDHYDA